MNIATLGDLHQNAHQCASTVRKEMERAAMHTEYIDVFSLDDHSKTNIGPNPMVSRQIKASHTVLLSQPIVVPDHDKKLGASFVPRGVMKVDHCRAGSSQTTLLGSPLQEQILEVYIYIYIYLYMLDCCFVFTGRKIDRRGGREGDST